jgi:cyclopropane fatty-acyl-phospholipid synthase-like methyltransferase
MREKPNSPATARNARPILEVIRYEFRDVETVLEIGSGTGQHAVTFADALIHLCWQTSDLEQNHTGISAWLDEAALPNTRAPLALDVLSDNRSHDTYDAVFSANTSHIMSFSAVESMFALVGRVLQQGGVFCLYGPFQRNGGHNSQSNAQFDRSLQERDAGMGIRDLEDLDELGAANRLARVRLYAMPANNYLAVWTKSDRRSYE